MNQFSTSEYALQTTHNVSAFCYLIFKFKRKLCHSSNHSTLFENCTIAKTHAGLTHHYELVKYQSRVPDCLNRPQF